MSWSMSFNGNAEEVTAAFDKQREQSASYGMIEEEQRDITNAGNFVAQFATKYGKVSGSASGHWDTSHNTFPPDASDANPRGETVHSFGRVSVDINAVAETPGA